MSFPYGAANAISMGPFSASTLQQPSSIAIGAYAGRHNLGANAIAIGTNAGHSNQHQSSIVINATGVAVNTANDNALYIAPMRFVTAGNIMLYNSGTKEITYSNTLTGDLSVNGSLSVTPQLNLKGTAFTVGGLVTSFYPVVIDSSPSFSTSGKYYFGINRGDVHTDQTWRGSLTSWFEGHTTQWGNGADFLNWDIVNGPSGGTYRRFIAGVVQASTAAATIIWLRGSTTYFFTGMGCSLYYANTGGVSPYTLPLGSGSEVYSSQTTINSGFDYSSVSNRNTDNALFSGNVGIGTNTPLSKLTIRSNYSGGPDDGFCINATDGSVYNFRLYPFVQGESQVGYNFRVNNNASSVDALTLGYNGNVGIGTTYPESCLEINRPSGEYNNTFTIKSNAPSIRLNGTGTTDRIWTIINGNTGYGIGKSNFGIYDETGSTYRFMINTAGRVGINTTSPEGDLHVKISGAASDFWGRLLVKTTSFWGDGCTTRSETAGTQYTTLFPIMLSNPHIVSDSDGVCRMRMGRSGGISTGRWWEVSVKENGDFRIGVEGNDQFNILPSGNIGIGVTNPSYKLHISNGDESKTYYGPNSTWSSYLIVGSGTNSIASTTAQVITTNGNLHLDAGNSKDFYIGYYANQAGTPNTMRSYGPWSHTGTLSTSSDLSTSGSFITSGSSTFGYSSQLGGVLAIRNPNGSNTHLGYSSSADNYIRGGTTFIDTALECSNIARISSYQTHIPVFEGNAIRKVQHETYHTQPYDEFYQVNWNGLNQTYTFYKADPHTKVHVSGHASGYNSWGAGWLMILIRLYNQSTQGYYYYSSWIYTNTANNHNIVPVNMLLVNLPAGWYDAYYYYNGGYGMATDSNDVIAITYRTC